MVEVIGVRATVPSSFDELEEFREGTSIKSEQVASTLTREREWDAFIGNRDSEALFRGGCFVTEAGSRVHELEGHHT